MVIVDFIYYKFGVLQYSIAKDLFFLDLKGLGGQVSDKDLGSFVINYLGIGIKIGFGGERFEKVIAFVELEINIKGLGCFRG